MRRVRCLFFCASIALLVTAGPDEARARARMRQVGYSGSLLPDHIPQLAGEGSRRAGLAYCVAYLRALLRRANEEVG